MLHYLCLTVEFRRWGTCGRWTMWIFGIPWGVESAWQHNGWLGVPYRKCYTSIQCIATVQRRTLKIPRCRLPIVVRLLWLSSWIHLPMSASVSWYVNNRALAKDFLDMENAYFLLSSKPTGLLFPQGWSPKGLMRDALFGNSIKTYQAVERA